MFVHRLQLPGSGLFKSFLVETELLKDGGVPALSVRYPMCTSNNANGDRVIVLHVGLSYKYLYALYY